MRIYLMTDLEGVAGVRDFKEWTEPGLPYYDLGRELLTQEVNAAVRGFFDSGATRVVVSDGHGPGAIRIESLDPRVELLRGWGCGWPLGLECGPFDFFACVGQHAKSRTPYSNMAHTQACRVLELTVNDVSIGEFGQMVSCASELGCRAIFAAGEKAFAEEAIALVPGIETVWGKRGNKPGRGDECSEIEYRARNGGAVHMHPVIVRKLIYDGARRALRRVRKEHFGLIPMKAPYRRVMVMRQTADLPRRYAKDEHATNFAALMNLQPKLSPIESQAQLTTLVRDFEGINPC